MKSLTEFINESLVKINENWEPKKQNVFCSPQEAAKFGKANGLPNPSQNPQQMYDRYYVETVIYIPMTREEAYNWATDHNFEVDNPEYGDTLTGYIKNTSTDPVSDHDLDVSMFKIMPTDVKKVTWFNGILSIILVWKNIEDFKNAFRGMHEFLTAQDVYDMLSKTPIENLLSDVIKYEVVEDRGLSNDIDEFCVYGKKGGAAKFKANVGVKRSEECVVYTNLDDSVLYFITKDKKVADEIYNNLPDVQRKAIL